LQHQSPSPSPLGMRAFRPWTLFLHTSLKLSFRCSPHHLVRDLAALWRVSPGVSSLYSGQDRVAPFEGSFVLRLRLRLRLSGSPDALPVVTGLTAGINTYPNPPSSRNNDEHSSTRPSTDSRRRNEHRAGCRSRRAPFRLGVVSFWLEQVSFTIEFVTAFPVPRTWAQRDTTRTATHPPRCG